MGPADWPPGAPGGRQRGARAKGLVGEDAAKRVAVEPAEETTTSPFNLEQVLRRTSNDLGGSENEPLKSKSTVCSEVKPYASKWF